MKKTNLFKTLTAITTAALMFAIPVSSAFADVHDDTPDVFRSDGITTSGEKTFDATEDPAATSSGDVKIIISNDIIYPTASNQTSAVYKVDVTWTNLEFTYTSGKWNPETHTYSTGGTLSNDGEGSITVTNHSNWAVKYTAGFGTNGNETSTSTDGFTATLSNSSNSINACAIAATDAPNAEIGVKVTAGAVTATDDLTLGTITVKITPDGNGKSNDPSNS